MNQKHTPPDLNSKWEYTEVIPNKLYICGEDEVDDLLYGEEEAVNINYQDQFINHPSPKIDVWIDLRDIRDSNRIVFIPETVEHISIPFRDGELKEAQEHLPIAKKILKNKISEGKRVLVSCHQGKSRSALLILWYLCEVSGNFLDAYWDLKSKRTIIEPDKNFTPLIEDLKRKYPYEII